MKGNPYLGIVVDNREPQDYIIRKEPEPLLKQGFAYHAYLKDGTPMYMAEPTVLDLEARLLRGYPIKSITMEAI
ncbi:hypothetical protein LCGC14_1609180 [marine sediment metagenome]|uniref:Uncharacterized protein n=1 Tax=marine sediment metagenome TaxID=412755 RepID=A0A0F9KPS8_9ZZZZ